MSGDLLNGSRTFKEEAVRSCGRYIAQLEGEYDFALSWGNHDEVIANEICIQQRRLASILSSSD